MLIEYLLMISVIVLTYNQEAYLRQTLDSILNQQVAEPIEIVIGDDHSSDGTSAIGRVFQEHYPDRVRYFYNTPNLGLVQNFIAMVRHCRGEYIALCDGDDYWTDCHKLQQELDVLRRDEQCVLVHTHRNLLAGDTVYEQPFLPLSEAENPQQLFFHSFVCVPTTLFRAAPVRSWLDTYERLSRQQDWRMQDFPLWLYLGLHGTFRYLSEATAMYRVLPNTLSRERDKHKQYRFDSSLLRIKRYFYPLYYACAEDKTAFRRAFREMEFHARKRMLLNYGGIAWRQVWGLVRLTPWLPMIGWRWLRRHRFTGLRFS